MISDFLKVYLVIKMLYFLSKLNKTCPLIYFSCTEDIVPKAPCNLELQRVIRRLKCHHCNVSPNIWITVSDFFVGNDSHPCLVTSNWKRLVVENLVRNGSLWSNFQQIWFRDLKFRIEVSKSSIWKHTTSCDQGFFSFIVISQLRWPIELKFSQICYFYAYVEIHQVRKFV